MCDETFSVVSSVEPPEELAFAVATAVRAGDQARRSRHALRRSLGTALASCACFSLALANHAVEFAYPLADVLTKVPFFGGNYPLALAFTIIFGVIVLASVTAAFMKHE